MEKYDIFISYDKADNKQLLGSTKGWVSYFQIFLEQILERILNRKPSFLLLPNQENPSAALIEKVQILVCIVSPSFIVSRNCLEDIDLFLSSAGNQVLPSNKRIFKVVKKVIPPTIEPSCFQNLESYDLYKRNIETGEVVELNDFFTPEAEKSFWIKLIDLAYDIAYSLEMNNLEAKKSCLIGPKSEHVIYLAQTGSDFVYERNYIKRELEKHGYKVIPEQPFPKNLWELEIFIRKNLELSTLSIHLLGDHYGEIPDHTEISIPELENKIADKFANCIHAENEYNSGGKVFKRIIWISPEIRKTDERQRSFIENLFQDAETLEGVEILQSPIEDLKSLIKKEILCKENFIQEIQETYKTNPSVDYTQLFKRTINSRKIRKEAENSSSTPNRNKLYLLYDKIDSDQGKLLDKFFKDKGFEVLIPSFEGELIKIRQKHIENLKECDIAVIHYGKVNEQWVHMKLFDLLKSPGIGRVKPLIAKAIYVSELATPDYDFYNNYEIDILKGNTSLFPESFYSFLAKLDKILYE